MSFLKLWLKFRLIENEGTPINGFRVIAMILLFPFDEGVELLIVVDNLTEFTVFVRIKSPENHVREFFVFRVLDCFDLVTDETIESLLQKFVFPVKVS